jgi:hypothetical protein
LILKDARAKDEQAGKIGGKGFEWRRGAHSNH